MKLRFTGENPPIDYLEQYPNWSNAYDEEGEDDQDETTLKPHEQQKFIDYEVSFTAADIIIASGVKYIALLEVIAGVPGLIDVYDSDSWVLSNRKYPTARWENLPQYWLPENQRMKEVSFDDTSIFPLQVKSRLPLENGKYIRFQIEIGGSSTELN